MFAEHFRFLTHILVSTEVRIHLTLNKTSCPLTLKHVFRGVVYEHDLTTHTDHISVIECVIAIYYFGYHNCH